jgi:hypothetical protein
MFPLDKSATVVSVVLGYSWFVDEPLFLKTSPCKLK